MDHYETIEYMKVQVAEAVRMAIAGYGISQKEAATRAGVERAQVNKIVKGHLSGITLQLLVQVAQGLGVECRMQVCLAGEEVRPKPPVDTLLRHLPDDY